MSYSSSLIIASSSNSAAEMSAILIDGSFGLYRIWILVPAGSFAATVSRRACLLDRGGDDHAHGSGPCCSALPPEPEGNVGWVMIIRSIAYREMLNGRLTRCLSRPAAALPLVASAATMA